MWKKLNIKSNNVKGQPSKEYNAKRLNTANSAIFIKKKTLKSCKYLFQLNLSLSSLRSSVRHLLKNKNNVKTKQKIIINIVIFINNDLYEYFNKI